MTEHDKGSAFEPRLPEDPAYWSTLAERITSSADPVFAELQTQQAWWNPLDRFGPALSVGAIAAAAAMFVALPAGDSAVASGTDCLEKNRPPCTWSSKYAMKHTDLRLPVTAPGAARNASEACWKKFPA